MNTTELKSAITRDMEMLKHLDVDIMEPGLYYREIRRLVWTIFLLLFLPTIAAELICIPFKWPSFAEYPMHHMAQTLLFPAFISLLFLINLFGLISEWVIFNHQLKSHLYTGDLLHQKACTIWRLPYVIYALSILLITPFFGWEYAVGVQFAAALIVPVILQLMINLEINRIGVSALFTVIKQYFESSQTTRGKYE